ncbi:hypothetical protein SDC9_138854 [bioreactor metagenome]|uniref:Protein-export membrane protein SecG n=1 Tax=bioreactor metagenome TaxID=1076179 RepID=A0A645DTF6_9ZZZZ|nr:preprotein translocase subunit SecG [Lachnospiraceae bacterium]
MSTLGMVLSVILGVLSVLLIVIILLQSSRSAGLGAVSSTNNDTYWGKNKGSSMEGMLEKYTKIGGAAFMVIAFIIMFVN